MGPPVSTPEPGQEVEVVIRGTVKRLGANGRAALITRADGVQQWISIPDDLTDAIQWKTAS